jgi:hypothetical protein
MPPSVAGTSAFRTVIVPVLRWLVKVRATFSPTPTLMATERLATSVVAEPYLGRWWAAVTAQTRLLSSYSSLDGSETVYAARSRAPALARTVELEYDSPPLRSKPPVGLIAVDALKWKESAGSPPSLTFVILTVP